MVARDVASARGADELAREFIVGTFGRYSARELPFYSIKLRHSLKDGEKCLDERYS